MQAISNVRAICDEYFPARHDLEIVDLLEHPTEALADGVIVTPTLLKVLPAPAQRLIGNLSDKKAVLDTLGSK
jgi:circadian clock protein KaiB